MFAIERYDIATGERSQVAGGPGGAVRPTPSPDGRWLAYVHRTGGRSRLYVKDLRSGEERQVYADLDQDLQETWAVHGVYPNMAWTPDSQTIVFWAGGKIQPGQSRRHRRRRNPLPGQRHPSRDRSAAAAWSTSRRPTVTTRMPRFAAVSPDGSQIVFETLGRLYIRDMAGGGAPRPLTAQDGDFQLFPTWSRDGSRIAFVSWNDQRLGEIRTVAADGSDLRTITRQPGHYRRPRFSPDGATIVYEASRRRRPDLEPLVGADRHLPRARRRRRRDPASSPTAAIPHFGAASDRVFLEVVEQQKRKLISVDLERRQPARPCPGRDGHRLRGLARRPRRSPSARITICSSRPSSAARATLDLGARGTAAAGHPRHHATAASYPSWTRGGQRLAWSLGPTLYGADTAVAAAHRAGRRRPTAAPRAGISLSITVPADVPQGQVALVGARDRHHGRRRRRHHRRRRHPDRRQPHPRGRPRAARSPSPPARAQVDVAGKTIIPGLIDGHAHGAQGEDDLIPQQNWSAMSHLAMGVTTVHDPSSTASEIFPAGEMQRAGMILAPAHLFLGRDRLRRPLAGPLRPDRFLRGRAQPRPPAADREGAHSIKNYNQPRRNQRQQVAAAARAENILVVPEGGSLFSDGHHPDPGRQFDGRAQYPAAALLRGRGQPLSRRPRSATIRPWSSPMAALPAIPIGRRRRRSGTIPC